MRTTLNIDEDVLQVAKSHALVRKISVGEALSELARRGMESRVEWRTDSMTGLPVVYIPGAPTITAEDVQRVQEQMDQEEAEAIWNMKP